MSSPEKFWQGLARAIEQPDLFDDPRFATREARIDNQEALIALLGERFQRAHARRMVRAPAAPRTCRTRRCTTPARRSRIRRRVHLQLMTSAEHPVMGRFRTVRSPVSFDGERALDVRPPPTLGEHNDEIRARRARPRGRSQPHDGTIALAAMRRPTPRSRRRRSPPALLAALAGMAQARRRTARSGWSCPFGPGTTTDTVGRVVADALGKALRQNVVVDNRAGAGGSTGTDQVAKAAADGRTLVMGTVGTHAINAVAVPQAALRHPARLRAGRLRRLHADAARRRRRLAGQVAEGPRRDGGAAARASTFASAGNGTSGHLAGELLAQRLGGKMIHVPYKEGAVAMTSVMSQQVDFMFYHPAAVMPQIKAGKLRALGASGARAQRRRARRARP